MAKRAVCVGINNYPGTRNDLSGCVNDARAWAGLLETTYRFDDVKLLRDGDATHRGILNALDALFRDSRSGDVAVLTYSGHGTSVPDRDSDEIDNRDEALYAHDGVLLDDELRKAITRLPSGVMLTLIIDACHSGTITREVLERSARMDEDVENCPLRERYMPPPEELTTGVRGLTVDLPVRQRFAYPESGMNEILLTACNANEKSRETVINGANHGIMTAKTIRILHERPDQTYLDLHRALRRVLPSRLSQQSPQLEGKAEHKAFKVFDNPGVTPSPIPSPTPPQPGPAPGPSGDLLHDLLEALRDVQQARQMHQSGQDG
jgi:hypothetical protein